MRRCVPAMLLAGCGFSGAPSTDIDASIALDAPSADAALIDAALDAAMIDAADVPLDAAVDAAIDAAPLPARFTQTLSWTQVPATLANFPVLVVLNAQRVDYTRVTDDGGSLRFTDANGAVLAHQIERWDEAGTSYIWVRVPSLTATGEIRMLTGDTSTVPAPPGPTQVWTANFVGVWHLGETVTDEQTSGTHADATGVQPMAQQRGNASARVTGGIGVVQEFDGTDDRIDVPLTNLGSVGALTIEARAYAQTLSSTYPHVLSARTSNDDRGWQIFWENSGDKWTGALRIGPTLQRIFTDDGATNAWQSLAITSDGTRMRLYLNGTEIGSTLAPGSVDALVSPFYLGANPTLDAIDNAERELDGYIDEVRVSNVARSPAWLAVSHRSASDGLLTYGTPQPIP